MNHSEIIPGFHSFSETFTNVVMSEEWSKAQSDFNSSSSILCVGNGGNLAVCDHGAIDIARLTDKQAMAPGSGILASSLINDVSHDLWVKNWLSICLRGQTDEMISRMMIIGVSSSGYSKNICTALDLAVEKGMRCLLISAQAPKINGNYNTVILNVDEYHSSEVLTLTLFYQLIHASGFVCPSISDSNSRQLISDYSYSEQNR